LNSSTSTVKKRERCFAQIIATIACFTASAISPCH
jgi:hypothetical protein